MDSRSDFSHFNNVWSATVGVPYRSEIDRFHSERQKKRREISRLNFDWITFSIRRGQCPASRFDSPDFSGLPSQTFGGASEDCQGPTNCFDSLDFIGLPAVSTVPAVSKFPAVSKVPAASKVPAVSKVSVVSKVPAVSK